MGLQKISIRLLRKDVQPEDAVRPGVVLEEWPTIEESKIHLSTMGGGAPKWSKFLELNAEELENLKNMSSAGIVMIPAEGRWFAITFGLGHVKIDQSKIEQDFGLKVVLNSVDPKLIRSADVRTPDENTLSRRSQTSRGSDQTAFDIDVERDIVRGLAGKPRDSKFASRVAGSDSLTIDRDISISQLPMVCTECINIYGKTDYQESFKWIDQIRNIRDDDLLKTLRAELIKLINVSLSSNDFDKISLAFPIIYDPEKGDHIQYRGFRSERIFPDLDITGYAFALNEKGRTEIKDSDLDHHFVYEVDAAGQDSGAKWPMIDCIAAEIELDGKLFIISAGRWYQIDTSLAKEVSEFFDGIPRFKMPPAEADDNEEIYNERQSAINADLICLDKQLFQPSGASSKIEICDFLSRYKELIHVKDKTSSSRLSHLFNQGTVSGLTLVGDPPIRDKIRDKISEIELEKTLSGYSGAIPKSSDSFVSSMFTIVYAVIAAGNEPKLPFFSLLTLRQAVRQLRIAGFKCSFAWINKPNGKGKIKAK